MARRVFLSFLGTNNYLPANYYFEPNQNRLSNVRFVQEALIKELCKDWSQSDVAYIFLTELAENNNWEDNGHKDRDGNPILCEGLKTRLNKLDHNVNIEGITGIPTGLKESEIWRIFDMVSQRIERDDEIIFDITHSFRTIPMLGMVLLNYLKFRKQITVTGVFYGAFETLGNIGEVAKMPVEQRNAPIVDLTALTYLQDWTNATRQFINNGRGEELAEQLINIHTKTYKQNSPFKAKTISKFGKTIKQLAQALSVNRINETAIASKSLVDYKKSVLSEFENIHEAKPFTSLIDLIIDQFERTAKANENIFSDNGFEAIVDMFKFYIATKQYPNAITIAREAVVSKVCVQMWIDPIDDRHVAEHLLNAWKQKIQSEYELKGFEYQSGKVWSKIVDIRNDINHASMKRSPMPSDALIKLINNIENDLSEYLTKTK